MVADISLSIASPRGKRTVSVAYERNGAGEPLPLLRGRGHQGQAREPAMDIIAGGRAVTAVDLPGSGASQPPPDGVPYRLSSAGTVLGSLCAALGVERPRTAGDSLGGLPALEPGRTGRARSVTALSPAGFGSESERVFAFAALKAPRAGARAMPVPVIEGLS
ncbi:hypothetical protein SYYSPA8_15310 [Streptomyces yaizuensis]|uniref:Alpha/beta hydrolase n=1 Tax=Streptomyces yaizuensis TaxID=2989713 RepID=A0ABQ5NZ99_9ACTN|nr:hypothetical protein [Streptomyces sp. YSPA8]GLF95681.1 hypothetical protein SYYSPA8_15310 [Streptomyces sp. YSPA8]